MSVVMMRCRRSYYQGTVHGRPRKSWKDNIKEWTGQSMSSLLRIADNRIRWVVIAADAHLSECPQRRLGVTGIGYIG